MLSAQAMRGKFRDGAVETASKERVVVMAYDRLDRDLAQGLDALSRDDGPAANEALCHAQALLSELRFMLDLDAWEHAAGLADLYDYMIRRLVAGNVGKKTAPVQEVQGLVAELGSAFRTAAREVMAAARPLSHVG